MSKARFRSRSVHTLDEKGRLNLPTRFREVLRECDTEILMLAPWVDHIRAFRLDDWEEVEIQLQASGGDPGFTAAARYIVGGVVECQVDKQGRIRIPPELREDARLDKDITLTGMAKWFEISDSAVARQDVENGRNQFGDARPVLSKLGLM